MGMLWRQWDISAPCRSLAQILGGSYLILFCLLLNKLDSLNLQAKDTTLQEAVQASKLALQYTERQWTENTIDIFYSRIVTKCKDFMDEPRLPRQRRPPRQLGTGTMAHTFVDPMCYICHQYFELLDTVGNELKCRFHWEGYAHGGCPWKLLLMWHRTL